MTNGDAITGAENDAGRGNRLRTLVAVLVILSTFKLYYVHGSLPAAPSIWFYSLLLSVVLGVMAATLCPLRDEPWRGRERHVWLYIGWWSGVLLGLVATLVRVAMAGWSSDLPVLGPGNGVLHVPLLVPGNLILYPCTCIAAVAAWSWGPRGGIPYLVRPRFRVRFLMAAVAYIGLLLGLTIAAARVGFRAREYQARYRKAKNLEQIILLRTQPHEATDSLRQMLEYQTALAEKYDRARERPWVVVGPDSPPP